MAQHISAKDLTQLASVSDAPARTRVNRTFGLPTGLYAVTVACYLAFLAVMSVLFMNGGLAIPMAVMIGFVIAAFGVCALWPSMNPDSDSSALTWGQLAARGVQTLSGPLTAGEAAIQVLILPVLIVVWGLAIAVIVALT